MTSRLKSLELHGFKTFANRTLFEFAEMVTAIVGPNGSGKSNITDSFRWVLGEQSYSLIRAKRTEDMIFSGSEGRARAGMASATITFDNSDAWLPIDFGEVAITRRAYRDGMNEYMINGQRVRLKDVSELLSQSGLAERTYTVISQGLVDLNLSLRADERRRLFEEAAGIGLYRSRREEALRRLEVTRRNLDRVRDILTELKPRVDSLERQARRSQEYEAVRADLQALLREWYGYHWHNAQTELAESQRVVQSHEAKLENARQEQTKLDGESICLRERTGSLREELGILHNELSALHARRETVSRELAVIEERKRSLAGQEENSRGERIALEEEIGRLQEQLEGTVREIERQGSDLEESRSQLEAARLALMDRQAERDMLEQAIQASQQELSSLSTRQGQLQAHIVENRAQSDRLRKALESKEEELARLEHEQDTVVSDLQAALKAEHEAEKALKAVEKRLLKQRKLLEEADANRKRAFEERSIQSAELARLETQVKVLNQAETALTGYANGTKLLLQAAQQQRLQGARGTLHHFLEVPADLEVAISAVLGEFIDAVLLDGQPDQALDLLQEQFERGVLLPLMNLRPDRLLKLSGSDGEDVLGIAADMIQTIPELRPAADLLLGGVIVVRDRTAARRVLAGKPSGIRAVTLRGEVFHANGVILSMGAGGPDGGQTLLWRVRQQREAAAECLRIRAELETLDHRLAESEAGLDARQAEINRLENEREETFQEYQKRNTSAQQARLTREEIERRLHRSKEEDKRLKDELVLNQQEGLDLTSKLARLEDQLSQARENLRQQSTTLDTLALDEFQSQFSHWTTLTAVAERALDDARMLHEERQSNLERLKQTQTLLQVRLDEFNTTFQALQESHASHLRNESDINQQIVELNQRIEPAEIELQSLEQEQTRLRDHESNLRQSVSLAEHLFTQTRITHARRQEFLESLRRRIEDDFGLVAFEYVEQVSGPTPLPLEGMVEQLPIVKHLSPEMEEVIKRQRTQLRRMGAINPEAQAEYLEVKQRFEFLTEQLADLEKAEADVHQVIQELDSLMESEFRRIYEAVNTEFQQIFKRIFGGGSSRLVLTNPDDLTASGIDIDVRLPGRRTQSLALLSGGERSLTATALIFALLKVSPTPFCVLDEVDAMLDESNTGRFRELLNELSQNTQFVIITHNRNTVQVADVIYGVSMGRDSVSQVLSLRLDEIGQVIE